MSNLTIRVLIALITFTIGIIAASVWLFYPSRKSELPAAQNSQLQSRNKSKEMQALREAQAEAKGERATSIAFLLAASGDDYEANRGKLLDALKECARKPYPEEEQCADFVADYLMKLSRRGDFALFKPLFDISEKADGALAQSLGVFYSDMLQEQPEQFLNALSPYPKKKQRDLCSSAGVEDGGGISKERFRKISQSLNNISDSPLQPIARTCVLGVEIGYVQAMDNHKSIKGD